MIVDPVLYMCIFIVSLCMQAICLSVLGVPFPCVGRILFKKSELSKKALLMCDRF